MLLYVFGNLVNYIGICINLDFNNWMHFIHNKCHGSNLIRLTCTLGRTWPWEVQVHIPPMLQSMLSLDLPLGGLRLLRWYRMSLRKKTSVIALTILVKVFRLQRKTLLLFFGFCFPIIKVFRLQWKTLLLFFGFFFPIIIFNFLTRFLPNTWTDFHEIFRDGRYCSGIEIVEPDFWYVTSGLKNGRFNGFLEVFLSASIFENYSR